MSEQPLILVVDDEANFREIFSLKLKAAGYRVETAVDGSEGVRKAQSLRPALTLMDVSMPVMDGAAAVLKLRDDADPNISNLKVAFLTSLGDPYREMQDLSIKFSEDFGAQGYLKKTDNLDILVEQIRSLLK
jgi:CheY-like chemotaxis protein